MTSNPNFFDKEELDELFYEELEARIIDKHGEVGLLKIRQECDDELILMAKENDLPTREMESLQYQLEGVFAKDTSHIMRLVQNG